MSREFEIKHRGILGEAYVCDYLIKRGYTIAQKNYRSRYGEIDIIAQINNTVAFVEVKTRTETSMTGGFESITKSKIRKIIKTAEEYIIENNLLCQPRIDCAQVIVCGSNNSLIDIQYIENAVENRCGFSPL